MRLKYVAELFVVVVAVALVFVACGKETMEGNTTEVVGQNCLSTPAGARPDVIISFSAFSEEDVTVLSTNENQVHTRTGDFKNKYSCGIVDDKPGSVVNKDGSYALTELEGIVSSVPCTFKLDDFETFFEPGTFPPPTAEQAAAENASSGSVTFYKKELADTVALGYYTFRGVSTQFQAECKSFPAFLYPPAYKH
jgi:hypothetical protein